MIFAVFEEKSIQGSYRFRVINAFKIRKNRSLAGIGGRRCHLAETTCPMDMATLVYYYGVL
jgi:hypothetical protein